MKLKKKVRGYKRNVKPLVLEESERNEKTLQL